MELYSSLVLGLGIASVSYTHLGFRKLDNLVVIVDNNGLQIDGKRCV